MFRACTVAAMVMHLTPAFRSKGRKSQSVGGVPMLNYQYRHLQNHVQVMGGPSEYDWIIKFKDDSADAQLESFCGGEAGVGACRAMGHPKHGGIPLATVRMSEEKLEELIMHNSDVVEFIEPDSPVDVEPAMHSNNDAEATGIWSLERVNKADAKFSGKGVHVYVMDTGVRVSHETFGGRAIATVTTIGGIPKLCSEGAVCGDTHGHGTHVAGTVGGNEYGLAVDATIHEMKVCCGAGTDINSGLDWIAQFAEKPAVMTMSLGSYSTPTSSRIAIDAVVDSGVTVTVSAGNRNSDACFKSYTFIDSAIGVGSTDRYDDRSSFSNYGKCNDIYAPGSSIVSASHYTDTGRATKSGTSMATPLVAGACALLLEESPASSPADVRSVLLARATPGVLGDMMEGDPNLLLNVR